MLINHRGVLTVETSCAILTMTVTYVSLCSMSVLQQLFGWLKLGVMQPSATLAPDAA